MYLNKRILFVTLARGGSKSVPKKNIALVAGVPLIAHTLLEGKKSKYMDDFIVSTDDDEIARVAESYGVRAPFRRSPELSSDTATSGDALYDALLFVEKERGVRFDVVVELMCTNPMKTAAQIDESIEMLVTKNADSVIAVTRVWDHHPARIKKIVDGKLVDFCVSEPREARRQDLSPSAYIRCGSIYTLSREYLAETRSKFGSANSYALVVPEDESVNIDSAYDFRIAELMLEDRSRRQKSSKLRTRN